MHDVREEILVHIEVENEPQDTNKTELMGCMRSEKDDSFIQRLRTRDRTPTRPS